tara:strand:+ start:751 stop:1674 length:924 start_codon:yes stop_codon:yes gene_type:complete
MSKIEVDEIVNQTGDNDSGLDLSTNDVVAVKIAGSEVARVDASGNISLGNGTATNDGVIHINAGNSAKNIVFEADRDSDGQGLGNLQFHSAGTLVAQVSGQRGSDDNGGQLTFYTATGGSLGEILRIHQNESITVRSSSTMNAIFSVNGGGTTQNAFLAKVNNNAYWNFHGLNPSGTRTFSVEGDGDVLNTNGSYGSISDEKLKENIVDASSQWDDIKAIKVKNFSLKDDKLDKPNKIGVIAQDLETSGMNGLVKDNPDFDENMKDTGTVTKSVKYSILYMKAVKALQEAMARIETLETKVTALEGK